MEKKRQPLTILICNLFLALTAVFFSPMEVVLANLKEFYFSFANVWWFQLLAAIAAAAVLTLVMIALPPRAGRIAAGLSLGLGLAAYVQALFLNGKMKVLSGEALVLSGGEKALNLAVWGLVILAAIMAVALAGKKHWKETGLAMRLTAAALTVMQAVGFASTALSTDLSVKQESHFLMTEDEFTFADDTNVVVFVLDTTDGVYVRKMMEEYPELAGILSGWTWYPNATSKYSRTFPALTYMLSGEEFFFDYSRYEYIEKAFRDGLFLPGLYRAGTDIRVFSSNPEYIGISADPYIANSISYYFGRFENMDLANLEKNLLKIAMYKSLPYQFKDSFQYDMWDINTTSFKNAGQGSDVDTYTDESNEREVSSYSHHDDEFYYDFIDGKTMTDKYHKAFRLYHLLGSHPGYDWDENLDTVEEDTVAEPDRALRGSFRIIELCIEEMKELGIYDKATIIITSDHGCSGTGAAGNDTLDRVITACPIMMVKPAGADTTVPMVENRAPVSHDEIFATVEKALGAPVSGAGSGKTFSDFTEGEKRERLYYFTASWEYAGPEVYVSEYVIDGDAEDFANWKLTGRRWDVGPSQ